MSVIITLSLIIIALAVTLAIFLKSTSKATTKAFVTTGNVNTQAGRDLNRNFLLLLNEILGTTDSTNTAIIYDVGNGGISGDPPCSSHTVINDPSRNVNQSGIGGTCDNGPLFDTSIGGRWIRFLGTGGTMIPQSSPGANHCSAFLVAWSNASLPSTIGVISLANICVESQSIAMCSITPNTKIVNCDSFYVYFLQPLIMCNARYCTT